ncbi:Qb-SNARE 2 [Giardia duodenalis]|uniref:Qb-SNARE 2 n=1 Tax=Giardia intestinalis (strain ATCC 50803 / WB clone C6) TaxID=184922 RepID=A0A644FBT4_GIAIC|nr:Qb-SNARE 2 [Giardia intestinalis]KAE8306078.1 Qb-SNARE 2 [Giardia intestinalis]
MPAPNFAAAVEDLARTASLPSPPLATLWIRLNELRAQLQASAPELAKTDVQYLLEKLQYIEDDIKALEDQERMHPASEIADTQAFDLSAAHRSADETIALALHTTSALHDQTGHINVLLEKISNLGSKVTVGRHLLSSLLRSEQAGAVIIPLLLIVISLVYLLMKLL